MTATQGEIIKATTAKVMTWPTLITAEAQKLKNGEITKDKKFSADFILSQDDPDLLTIKRAVIDEVKRVFSAEYIQAMTACSQGGQKPTVSGMLGYLGGRLNLPLTDGTVKADARVALGKTDGEYARGKTVLHTSSREASPPALGGVVNGRVIDYATADQRAMNAGQFYFGVEAYFKVNVKAYNASSTVRGVSAYLQTVVTTNTGDRIGPQGASATEDFGHVSGHVSAVNPLDDLGSNF